MYKITSDIIDAWKILFELEPTLNALPVYAWGRYYMYELAGSPFESYVENFNNCGFARFIDINPQYDLQVDLIKSFDWKYLRMVGNGDIGDYQFDRHDIVKQYRFDDRGGMCLIMVKNNDGYDIIPVKCNSPE